MWEESKMWKNPVSERNLKKADLLVMTSANGFSDASGNAYATAAYHLTDIDGTPNIELMF